MQECLHTDALVTSIISSEAIHYACSSAVPVWHTEDQAKLRVSDLSPMQGLKAGAVAGKLAKLCGGGGGGKPNLATAGGKDPSGIPAALEAAQQELRDQL